MKQIYGRRKLKCKGAVIVLLFIMCLIAGFGRLSKLLEIKTAEASQVPELRQQIEKLGVTAKVATASSKPVKLSEEAFDELLSLLFPPKAAKRFKEIVTKCENSTRDPEKINVNKNGTYDLGVAQINQIHAQDVEKLFGEDFYVAMSDSIKNILYAAKLYQDQGNFSAWTCDRLV